MRDVLPSNVFVELQDHLRSASLRGEQGWLSGKDEEDTLTGDLGGSLRRDWQQLQDVDGRTWRWRMTYTKFRGRGKDAEEKLIGADGIIQIEVEDLQDRGIQAKGLLFQAKKTGNKRKQTLIEQVRKMESIAPHGAAVFEYGSNQYSASDARLYIGDSPSTLGNAVTERLGDYLADRFLPCDVGTRGMYYDAVRTTLFVPNATEGVRLVRVKLGHRFRIEVETETV